MYNASHGESAGNNGQMDALLAERITDFAGVAGSR